MNIAFFDTKPYDREFMLKASQGTAEELDWKFHEFRLSAETAKIAEGCDVVCAFVNCKLDAECLEILARNGTQLVAMRCAGFNNVDQEAAKRLGIRVTRVPAYSPHAVAEHAVGLLLTLNRKIHRAHNRVREHNFSLNGLVGFDIAGKTVGIIGAGKIGRITAQIFRGFDANVLVHDQYQDEEWASRYGVSYVDLGTLLQTSDILSLHAPLVPETYHLIRAETLKQTRPGVYLVNTSRGKLIDTSDLIQFLKTGHVGGVALDVYEEEEGIFFEDLSDQALLDDDLSRLLSFPNVLVTSHQAFLTREALSEIARVTVENSIRMSKGEPFLSGSQVL